MNQRWVMVDDGGKSKTVYVFKSKDKLLLSRDGLVEKATWKMVDSSTISVTIRDHRYLFKHGFLDKSVLALQLDGRQEYVLFVNKNVYQKVLGSYDKVTKYLSSKYLPKTPIPEPRSKYMPPDTWINFDDLEKERLEKKMYRKAKENQVRTNRLTSPKWIEINEQKKQQKEAAEQRKNEKKKNFILIIISIASVLALELLFIALFEP